MEIAFFNYLLQGLFGELFWCCRIDTIYMKEQGVDLQLVFRNFPLKRALGYSAWWPWMCLIKEIILGRFALFSTLVRWIPCSMKQRAMQTKLMSVKVWLNSRPIASLLFPLMGFCAFMEGCIQNFRGRANTQKLYVQRKVCFCVRVDWWVFKTAQNVWVV